MSIVITDTELELALKDLLQKRTNFRLNGRVWRTGRIILFKQNGFFLEFIIKNDKKKQERFETPIPFNVSATRNIVVFDYKLNTLTGGDQELLTLVSILQPAGKSKFFDTVLEVEIVPDVIENERTNQIQSLVGGTTGSSGLSA